MHVQCHANICTESTVKHMVATEFLQLSKFQPLSSCLFPFNLPLPHEYLYAPCIDVLLTVNATKMAKLRPVFTWRWWKVTPGWIELVLGKQRFWSLKPTGALQTMLMYKASYQSCSCSHLLTLIYKQQVSLQFFLYPTDCGQTAYCFKPTYPSAC